MTGAILAGIAGGSGSGKTTLAEGLRERMGDIGGVVVSQDDYYRGLPDGVAASDYNFDEPAAIDLDRLALDLASLKAGRGVRRPIYDFVRHRRSDAEQETAPAPLIIVEGLFLFVTPALRDIFDIRVFADVPEEERLRRRIRRDVLSRGRTEGEIRAQWVRQTEPMYLRHILPTRACAHLVLEFPPPDTRTGRDQIGAIREIVEAALHAP